MIAVFDTEAISLCWTNKKDDYPVLSHWNLPIASIYLTISELSPN